MMLNTIVTVIVLTAARTSQVAQLLDGQQGEDHRGQPTAEPADERHGRPTLSGSEEASTRHHADDGQAGDGIHGDADIEISKAGITKPAPKMNHSTMSSRLASSVSLDGLDRLGGRRAPNTIPPTNAETNGFPRPATRGTRRASANVASRREPCCIQPR